MNKFQQKDVDRCKAMIIRYCVKNNKPTLLAALSIVLAEDFSDLFHSVFQCPCEFLEKYKKDMEPCGLSFNSIE